MSEELRKLEQQLRSKQLDAASFAIDQLPAEPDLKMKIRDLCFRVITEDPTNLQSRLLLSRLFYEDKLYEFAIRELLEIRRRAPQLQSVQRLLGSFGPHADFFGAVSTRGAATVSMERPDDAPAAPDAGEEDDVVAEIDIDDEFLDALDKVKGGSKE